MKTEKAVYTCYKSANFPRFALREHMTLTGLLRSYKELDTPDFNKAWSEWLVYLREKRKSPTATTQARQLAKLAAWGPATGIASIEASISNGWQGLFEPTQEHARARTIQHSGGAGRWQRFRP